MSRQVVEKARSYFNWEIRKHPSFLLFDEASTNFFRPSESYAANLLGDRSGMRVLDIGCGDAVDSITLARQGNAVWGVDVAENRLDFARQNVRTGRFESQVLLLAMDAHSLAFKDESFDLVIGNSVLLFLQRDEFARECHRVLKPGAFALFSHESMRWHPLLILRRLSPRVRRRETAVASRLTVGDIDRFARNFDWIRHEEFYLFSPLAAPMTSVLGAVRLVSRLTAALQRFDALVFRRFPYLRRFGWVTVVAVGKKR